MHPKFMGLFFVAMLSGVPALAQLGFISKPAIAWSSTEVFVPNNQGIQVLRKDRSQAQGIKWLEANQCPRTIIIKNTIFAMNSRVTQMPEGQRALRELHRHTDKGWEVVATYTGLPHHPAPYWLIPCSDDLYFGIANGAMRAGRENRSPFWWFTRQNDQTLTPMKPEPLGLDPIDMYDKGMSAEYQVAIAGDYAIILSSAAGFLWSLDLEKGKLRGPAKLFPDLSLEAIRKGAFPVGTYGLQPAEDGNVLILSRAQEAMVGNAGKGQREMSASLANNELSAASLRRLLELESAALKDHPFLVWWELNPSTLKLKKLSPPPFGAKEMIGDAIELSFYDWIPLRDGSIGTRVKLLEDLSPKPTRPTPPASAVTPQTKAPKAPPEHSGQSAPEHERS